LLAAFFSSGAFQRPWLHASSEKNGNIQDSIAGRAMTDSLTPETGQFDETVVATAEPVHAAERINAIDMLRGVAVLGILVMNIYGFAMPFAAYGNPLAYGGTEPLNIGTWFFTHVFFDLKFMTIFSMLYGAGMIMLMTRAETRGVSYEVTWIRRNFWLLLIGAVHGYLIWWGDILFHYAIVGMIVFLFRHRPAKSLISIAVVVLAVAPLLHLFRTRRPVSLILECVKHLPGLFAYCLWRRVFHLLDSF